VTPRVHQTGLVAYEKCPALYKATIIDRLPDDTYASRVGTACHHACEAVTRASLGASPVEPYLAARNALLALTLETGPMKPPLTSAEFHEASTIMERVTGPRSAINLRAMPGWSIAPEVPLYLDAEFRPVAAADADSAAYGMTLDRLQFHQAEGLVEVWDYKTGQDWMSGDDVADDTQAQWYSFAALQHFPDVPLVTFRRVMLRLGYVARCDFHRDSVKWQERIRDRFTIGRRQIGASVAHGVFLERVGSWCRYCPRRGVCASAQAVLQRGAVTWKDEGSREERARRVRWLGKAVEEAKDALKEDVTVNGPVQLTETLWYGARSTKAARLKNDPDATKTALRQAGMTPEMESRIFAPSAAALPGLVRETLKELFPKKPIRDEWEDTLLAEGSGTRVEEYER